MAKDILTSKTLRWSAPSNFADPFELDHNSVLSFTSEDLLQAAIQTATAMIFAKDGPRGTAPLLNAIRRWRDEERFASPEEAHDVLGELMAQVVTPRQAAIDEMMHSWQLYAHSVRICSFCDKADNPIAWKDLADNHRGVSLRFNCLENSNLSQPQKVQYKKVRPEITTLKDQVAVILGNSGYIAQDHFQEQLLTKPYYCSSEREWRCFQTAKTESVQCDTTDTHYNDLPFEPHELSAVYFGAFIDDQAKNDLLKILQQKHPKTRLYQASVISGKYELEFSKL